jgi:DNA polymerase
MTELEILQKAQKVNPYLKWVPGEGPTDAVVALIGEAPGAEEDNLGRPFVGRAGKLLDRVLETLGIRRDSVYITNCVKIWPPQNKLADLEDYGLRVGDFTPFLIDELKALPKLRYVIPLGATALKVVCGLDGITAQRGSELDVILPGLEHLKAVPTYHPAYVVRGNWPALSFVLTDFRKVFNLAYGSRLSRFAWPHVYIPEPTPEHLTYTLTLLEEMGRAEAFSYDIETQFGRIACLGIYSPDVTVEIEGVERTIALVIPFKRGPKNYWDDESELALWKGLRKLFASPALKIAQNGVYDMTFLLPFVGLPAPPWFDTMLAHSLLDPESPHKLETLTSLYTDVPYYKDDYKSWKASQKSEELWLYNSKDIIVTYLVYEKEARDLKRLGLDKFFAGFTMPEQRAMFLASRRGVRIDEKERKALLKVAEAHVEKMQAELEEIIGHEINVGSPKQVNQLLYEELRFPVQKDRKTKKPTGSMKAIDRLLAYHAEKVENGRKILNLLKELKSLKKTISSYLKVKTDGDGLLRYEAVISGTETGRMSTRKTPHGSGCLLPQAEVLTPKGWVPLHRFQQGLVMQWDPDSEKLEFLPAVIYRSSYKGPLLAASSRFHQNIYTPDHRIPCLGRQGNKVEWKEAEEVASYSHWRLPIGGFFVGGPTSFPLARLAEVSRGFLEFLKDSKAYGEWLLSLDAHSLEALVDEAAYWDAHKRGESYIYSSALRTSCEWLATAAHLVGRSATLRKVYQCGGWNARRPGVLYQAAVKPLRWAWIGKENWGEIPYDGDVFCLHTETGYFLVRYNGVISITGNCNIQTIPERFPLGLSEQEQERFPGWARRMFIPHEGNIFIQADLSQAEAVAVAHFSRCQKMIDLFKQPDADIHRMVASWALNKSPKEVTKEERKRFKRAVHGGNYGISPLAFAIELNVDIKTARDTLEKYHATLPEIRAWWREIEDELSRSHRVLWTPLGRRRLFKGFWGRELFKEAYAYLPQSTVADLAHHAILKLHYVYLPDSWWIVQQSHDSVLIQGPRELVEEAKEAIKKAFDKKVLIHGRWMTVGLDVEILEERWGK